MQLAGLVGTGEFFARVKFPPAGFLRGSAIRPLLSPLISN